MGSPLLDASKINLWVCEKWSNDVLFHVRSATPKTPRSPPTHHLEKEQRLAREANSWAVQPSSFLELTSSPMAHGRV